MTNNPRIWAVIPASGIGQRMQSDRPKQYLSFCNKTVIEHTLDRLLACDQVCGVILVLRADDEYWGKLQYTADKPLFIAHGGVERQDSVINGLNKLHEVDDTETCLAMVHDAVRPLVKPQDLSSLIKAFDQNENGAILAAPIADTLKRADKFGCIAETVDRVGLWRAFTPQLFNSKLLLEALQEAKQLLKERMLEAILKDAIGKVNRLTAEPAILIVDEQAE